MCLNNLWDVEEISPSQRLCQEVFGCSGITEILLSHLDVEPLFALAFRKCAVMRVLISRSYMQHAVRSAPPV